jgi:hypothetical protein
MRREGDETSRLTISRKRRWFMWSLLGTSRA